MGNIKTELCRYHNLEEKVNSKIRLIKEYERLATTPASVDYDKVGTNPSQSTKAFYEKIVHLKIKEEKELEGMITQLNEIKDETLAIINRVDNDDKRSLLIYRYLEWLSWDQICRKMFISKATAFRWHGESIEILKFSKNETR